LIGLQHDDPWPQELNADIKSYATFGHLFGKERWTDLFERAKSNAQNVFEQAETAVLVVNKTKEARVKYVFEYHSKFSMAVACFIFLFIGAPMGAIVRKGGFGWPLLISIFFFMLFVVITIFSKNIAERFVIDAVLGAWMNCLIVFPLGLMLTYWAMRDTSLQQIADFFRIKLPMPQKKYS
jgi:lipopolysaccharide export system permease protein